MPLISCEFLIVFPRNSTPIINSKPERGQPCLVPLVKEKCLLAKPLLSTQLEMLL